MKYRQLALQYITMAFSRNPASVRQEIGLGDYAELGANPCFTGGDFGARAGRARSASHDLRDARQATLEERVGIGRCCWRWYVQRGT